MLKSPGIVTGRLSSLCRQWSPQLFLLVLLFLTASNRLWHRRLTVLTKPIVRPAEPSGVVEREQLEHYTKIQAGLGAVVLALVAFVVYQKNRGEKKKSLQAPSDIVGGYRLQNLMMTDKPARSGKSSKSPAAATSP